MGAAEVLLSTLRNENLGEATANGPSPPVATPARPPNKESAARDS